MINEIYAMFKRNLPQIERGEATVRSILSDPDNHIIFCQNGSQLAGVSVINSNTIYLLCVDKPFQHLGIGRSLLAQSERYIQSKGHDTIVLGAGKEYIMPGVPMHEGAQHFFEKYGYVHSWGDDMGCFDMEQDLAHFTYDAHSAGDSIDGITYRWAVPEDRERVVACITEAHAKFLPFYRNEKFYKKGTERPILIAERDQQVLGAILLYIGEDMGSVGATATHPQYRGQGIATHMVTLGTKHLKDLGLKRACLGYTYTQIVHMYGKAGYQICMEYFMGEKKS